MAYTYTPPTAHDLEPLRAAHKAWLTARSESDKAATALVKVWDLIDSGKSADEHRATAYLEEAHTKADIAAAEWRRLWIAAGKPLNW
jgi:hypothetical protein